MNQIKKFTALALSIAIAAAMFTTSVHAISFVELFGSITGEVVDIISAQSGGYFVEIEREYGVSRLYVSTDTYVLGESLSIGDTITGYFGSVALASFEGAVMSMTRIAPGQYDITVEYTGMWRPVSANGTSTFRMDFNRTFLRPFEAGDRITAYYNPWGESYIFDMPQYNAAFIVNGDYDVYIGALSNNRVSNSMLAGDDDGIWLDITGDTIILTGSGESFTSDLIDGTHLALVFSGTDIEKVVVIWQLDFADVIWNLELNPVRGTREPRDTILNPPVQGSPYRFFYELPSPWAIDQVITAIDMGLVPAILQSDFTEAITRTGFSTLAVNMYEYSTGSQIPGRTTFTDTTDINVEKAAYIGIVSGVGNNQFNPNGVLTREQAAVMLQRLFSVLNDQSVLINMPELDMPYLPGTFADYYQISPWARNAVAWVYGLGIMGGTGNRMFSPGGDYTVEQSIVTIMRVFEFVDGEHTPV